MTFFDRFKNWFGNVFTIVAKTVIGRMADSLKDIAIEACKQLNSENLSNDKKRKMAFNKIKNSAIKEGKEFSDSAINLAIELAVAIIKEGFEGFGDEEN